MWVKKKFLSSSSSSSKLYTLTGKTNYISCLNQLLFGVRHYSWNAIESWKIRQFFIPLCTRKLSEKGHNLFFKDNASLAHLGFLISSLSVFVFINYCLAVSTFINWIIQRVVQLRKKWRYWITEETWFAVDDCQSWKSSWCLENLAYGFFTCWNFTNIRIHY